MIDKRNGGDGVGKLVTVNIACVLFLVLELTSFVMF